MFRFQKLDVYNRSILLSTQLIKIASNFNFRYKRISDQLIGAVISIALNIAEGQGRINSKERIQFYRISIASAFELIAILDICEKLDLINKNKWEKEITEICKMMNGLIKSQKSIPKN